MTPGETARDESLPIRTRLINIDPMPSALPPIRILAVGAMIGCVPCGTASSQDFSLGVAGADRMLRDGILPDGLMGALFDPTLEGTVKGQFAYSLSTSATYTSNSSLSRQGGSDLIWSLSPSIAYTTDPEGGATYVLTAYYAPSYQYYFEDSSRGGFNQNGGVSFATSGARASVSAFLNLAQSSGGDRITGGYSEGTIFNGGLSGSYQVAPRTNVWSSLTASFSDYSTGQRGSDIYSAQLGAFWSATERLSMGPSLRYNRSVSDTTGERTATGLLFNANYVATERIRMSASIGAEIVENSRISGSSGPSLTGDFSMSYRINELWSTSASIRYANVPSPSSAGYIINDLSFSAAVSRALLRGSLSAGISYGIASYETVDSLAVARGDEKTTNLVLSYSRPLFSDRISFFSSANYSISDDWEQWSLSSGLSMSF